MKQQDGHFNYFIHSEVFVDVQFNLIVGIIIN